MPIPFPTDEWIKALMVKLNESAAYRDAAKNWEGDFAFIVTEVPNAAAPVHLYMDLWHGECRSAFEVKDPLPKPPEFFIESPLNTWRKVIEKRLDPIQGIVTRQLKLSGPLVKVMRAPKAAMELVNCCTRIETQWPELPAA
jgi:putative sterol carrier protein